MFRPRRENGAFAAGQFAESKSAHRAQLEQLIDDKASYAALQCAQRMARPGETFAIHPMGALAELEQLTPETLWPIYQSFLRSGQIDVFVFGDITEHQALAVARRLLEGIERQEPVTLFQGTAGCPECITCREEEEVLDVEQGRLVLGYRRPLSYTPEALARNALFLNIFGASDQSRLFLQLREAESLCYDVDVDQDVFNGILWVQTGIDFANKQQAVDMIRSILLDLSERGPTAEELETARILSRDAIRSLADVPSALVGMQLRNLTGGAWITVEQLTAAMQAVSADDIRAEAARACCDLIYFLRGEAS